MAPKKGAKKTKEQLAEEKRLAEEAAIAAQEGTIRCAEPSCIARRQL